MRPLTFEGPLERDTDGTWWFVHVPKEVREALKHLENRGAIKVTATIGATTWDCSLLPWADGSAQVTVPKKIRAKEQLELGTTVRVSIVPR